MHRQTIHQTQIIIKQLQNSVLLHFRTPLLLLLMTHNEKTQLKALL